MMAFMYSSHPIRIIKHHIISSDVDDHDDPLQQRRKDEERAEQRHGDTESNRHVDRDLAHNAESDESFVVFRRQSVFVFLCVLV